MRISNARPRSKSIRWSRLLVSIVMQSPVVVWSLISGCLLLVGNQLVFRESLFNNRSSASIAEDIYGGSETVKKPVH